MDNSAEKKAVIYTTPSCVYCKMAKEFFKKNGVVYEERDVASDTHARNDMIQKSGQMGVPVIEAGGRIIIGFDQSRLREALGIAG
ncbi:MAG: NrdH-redoxin [Candidatus Sungbacteria bacterium RIFCSPHIGHO2_02_FULL_52_23]|uniref:NrdH-redoxin n=1 Tax=Candidatus Sungbacteria bacterium RIFCSPHIGHO2_02_FULL_52_23 TaxID=1802274 RepID=A0A1G2KX69_9BACT|nr:MAG: NrdH-redoxin [Candidatus Sungbacteria bacterium RIFCSPHIGHO2_02_FULL_52_23]